MQFNFKKEVTTNKSNFLNYNPIKKTDVKRKKINGEYVYERFYLIDFLDIKKDSYVISSFGRIFSLINNRELNPRADKNKANYTTIILCTDGGGERKYPLHRLVALAFLPKSQSDKAMTRQFIHHKNWDNEYNYYWNLEWRSRIEIAVLEKLSNEEMEEDDIVVLVCRLLQEKETVADIFRILNGIISKDKISKIKNKTIHTIISKDYSF